MIIYVLSGSSVPRSYSSFGLAVPVVTTSAASANYTTNSQIPRRTVVTFATPPTTKCFTPSPPPPLPPNVGYILTRPCSSSSSEHSRHNSNRSSRSRSRSVTGIPTTSNKLSSGTGYVNYCDTNPNNTAVLLPLQLPSSYQIGTTKMKWFGHKSSGGYYQQPGQHETDSGPQLLSLSPLRLDEDGGDEILTGSVDNTNVFFGSRGNGVGNNSSSSISMTAPSTPNTSTKRRTRGRSKFFISNSYLL